MAVTSPTPIMRTTREPEWTPRQREVLDLLVKGRTNGEIASTLGISLDGAKWHVSEIITRLGVDSRDEAAEYWRHRNGLRMRFTRVLHAFFGSNALKFAGVTAAVGAFIAATALVVFALNDSGDGSPQAGEPTPPAESSTPDPTQDPAETPVPTTPTVDPNTGEVVMDVPVRRVTVGDSVAPANVWYIVEKGCWQCDGSTAAYERVSFEASGASTRETIFEAPSGYVLSGRFGAAGEDHYVAVCSTGYCGGVGEMSDDAETTVYRSTDDGETWEVVGTYPGSAAIGALTADGPILFLQEVNLGPVSLERLDGTEVTAPVSGFHPYGYRGLGFAWMSDDYQSLLMPDGSPLASGDLGGHRYADSSFQFVSLLPDGSGALVSWWHGDEPSTLTAYLGVFRNGELERVFETGQIVFAGSWLDETTFAGNMAMDAPAGSDVPGGMANQPIAFSIETGDVTPIELYGPLFTAEYAGRNNIVGLGTGS